jgi:hypothetical protein
VVLTGARVHHPQLRSFAFNCPLLRKEGSFYVLRVNIPLTYKIPQMSSGYCKFKAYVYTVTQKNIANRMDNTTIERSRQQVRRSMIASATVMVISAGSFMNMSKNSNIRAVEILSLLACGISIGAFLVTLVLSLKMKKQA